MKIKNLKIGTQLKLGFGILILFVFILGYVSYQQTNRIHEQTEILYNHPLQVSRAIGIIEKDIRKIQVKYRDMLLAENDTSFSIALQEAEVCEAEVMREFDVLFAQYLGPKSNVKDAQDAFIRWMTLEKSLDIESGKKKSEVVSRFRETRDVGKARRLTFSKIEILDNYAINKANELFVASQKLNGLLNNQLLLLVLAIALLSLLVNYAIHFNIRHPLIELTNVTRNFHKGDLNARSSYQSENELGELSDSINILTEAVQVNTELSKKTTDLAEILIKEDEPVKFFRSLIQSLSSNTGSQMAAIYLISEDKKHFECYDSIGLSSNARQKFNASILEGEFGAVLAEKKIVHINSVPEDVSFSFFVATGEFKPREIITIPILDQSEVVAVISLATLHQYTELSIQLLQNIWVMLMSRVVGVLSLKKITEFSTRLELQNIELGQQARKLAMQADEMKEYNIELELQKKQLDEANQLKSAFLSNMSHELRTPLNSVIALSGVLNRRLKSRIPEDEYNYLGIIEKNGRLLLSLINDILDLSRIEAGKEELNYSTFSVQNLIRNIVETLLPIAMEKGINLFNNVQLELPPIVSDSVKFQHILQNIIGNAVKFTEKGTVEVSAELKDKKLYIGIKDTGIGISNENLPFIFDEFRQVDGNASRKFGGTGLGLAIAKKYVEMMNGSIEVKSQEGAGSIFVVMIPENPVDFSIQETRNERHDEESKFKVQQKPEVAKTLLLVEDSEPQIIQLTDILKEEGYRVQIARNGKEALDSIQESVPDAMILDLMMPEIDGFEVLDTIRKQEETLHLPVLILSAKHVTKEELSFLKENHIHQLIQKGDINRTELLMYVEKMLYVLDDKTGEQITPHIQKNGSNGKANILLIEDNEDNITTVKALLEGKYNLQNATDGLAGLEKAKSIFPDLILLDISLPKMDGIDVLKELKNDARFKRIPIIALTARAMKGDREELLGHGFDDYISKPIDSSLFEMTIRDWLNGNKML